MTNDRELKKNERKKELMLYRSSKSNYTCRTIHVTGFGVKPLENMKEDVRFSFEGYPSQYYLECDSPHFYRIFNTLIDSYLNFKYIGCYFATHIVDVEDPVPTPEVGLIKKNITRLLNIFKDTEYITAKVKAFGMIWNKEKEEWLLRIDLDKGCQISFNKETPYCKYFLFIIAKAYIEDHNLKFFLKRETQDPLWMKFV